MYESWAQLLDPPFLAPRLHVWGTLGEFALDSTGLEFLLRELGGGSSLQPTNGSQAVINVIRSERPFLDTTLSPNLLSRSSLLLSYSPEFVWFTLPS